MPDEEDRAEGAPPAHMSEAEPMGVESPAIYDGAIAVGRARLRNSRLLMWMNGLIGGLFVTFSGLGAMTVLAALGGDPASAAWLVAALLYPVGFVFVLLGKSELFTENFLTPVLATWDRGLGAVPLLRLWGITLAANLVGIVVAALAWAAPPFHLLPDATRAAFVAVATEELERPMIASLAKGVIGGMLVNFMSWLVIAARGHLTKLAMMIVPTYLIMALRAAHSVVGSFEVLVGLLSGAPGTAADWLLRFLLPVGVGNMVGGVVFVSALHYAQVREEKRVIEEEHAREDEAGGDQDEAAPRTRPRGA